MFFAQIPNILNKGLSLCSIFLRAVSVLGVLFQDGVDDGGYVGNINGAIVVVVEIAFFHGAVANNVVHEVRCAGDIQFHGLFCQCEAEGVLCGKLSGHVLIEFHRAVVHHFCRDAVGVGLVGAFRELSPILDD